MVTFPELLRGDALELPVVGALSALAGGLLSPFSLVLGTIAFIPCGLWLLYSIWLGILNARLRYSWSLLYSRRLPYCQLRTKLRAEPERFIVHVRYFGGFAAVRLCPAAVVEDRHTGNLTAIYPSSWRVLSLCEQIGVPLVKS